jgi:hypothetical protein
MTATRKTVVRPPPSALRLDRGEVAHVGVDVHKGVTRRPLPRTFFSDKGLRQ